MIVFKFVRSPIPVAEFAMRRCAAHALHTLFVLLLAACSDPVAEARTPIEQPELPEPRPSLPALLVSEARVFSPPGGAVHPGSTQLSWIALPPGSLPGVVALRIRNPALSDALVTVLVIEGGFDPVAIAAAANDELELTLKHLSGTFSTAYARVPAKRPPVIVRTYPSKGRTDVALGVIPTVIFSEPIEPRTASAGVRLFQDGEEVAARVEMPATQPWNVRLVPDAELEPATAYELRIMGSVRDLEGDSVEVELRVPFTTAQASPPPPAPPPPAPPPLPLPAARIAFVSSRNGGWDLYVADADGSGARLIRGLGQAPSGTAGCVVNSVNFPSISPDGTRIIFVPEWMGPAGACLITADGSSERPLPFYGPGSWSPDGTRILYSGPGGDNDIYTMNSDGTGMRRILDLESLPGVAPGRSVDSEWLPDGTVAFAVGGELWSMKDDGSEVRALGATVPGGSLDWSPDGSRIAFVASQQNTYVIGSTAADGTDVRIHVSSPDSLWDPEWSPDGRYIAFVGTLEGRGYRIFVVDVESGAVGPLLPEADTNGQYSDWDVSWARGLH